ncbi:MAG: hypothetical protein LQ343_007561 [Gyalolechia ehrenbergii]|nr:MAG: hypothetical protein LQ343_007561 [Gyalolechia ehrenbergii]
MDTNAYLTRQGWRGNGHALHPSGHGIKKPLLVSKRTDRIGVGKKAHDAHADQWWSRAFDETLRSLNGEDPTKETTGTDSTTVIQTSIYKTKWNGGGGLYSSFVRGQGLKGTISSKEQAIVRRPDEDSSKKTSSNGSARIENNAGKKSSSQDPDDGIADRRTKKHSVKPAKCLPRGQAPIKSTSPERSVSEKTIRPREVARSLKTSDRIVPDIPSRVSNEKSEGDMAQRNHGAVKGKAVAIQKTVADPNKAPLSDYGARHHVEKRGKTLKEDALRAVMVENNIDSESNPEQQVKTKKRRRRRREDDGR